MRRKNEESTEREEEEKCEKERGDEKTREREEEKVRRKKKEKEIERVGDDHFTVCRVTVTMYTVTVENLEKKMRRTRCNGKKKF